MLEYGDGQICIKNIQGLNNTFEKMGNNSYLFQGRPLSHNGKGLHKHCLVSNQKHTDNI
jgi:hypothetical protein